ncbi:phosphatases II [Trametopsis cervina]|nr:phosphatases II [Trametopsis cervina]
MDAIRVAKVEGVLCSKAGSTLPGTVHLTAHHLIFAYDDTETKELWVPYPLMSLVTRMPHTLKGQSPITCRTRSFETFTLSFVAEKDAQDVFDSVRDLTVATSVTQLYAFHYVPNPPFPSTSGWTIYSPREEFGRMGVGTRTKAWRFTDINKDYSFCGTYPAKLVVPTRISDATLQYATKYRSKGRLPVLTYLHWANYGTITRSSQPMVGLTQSRSIQDEKLVEAIFHTHHAPSARAVSGGPIYGATSTNIIIDARPTTNAVANTAKGAGTENMDHYKDARKAYLGIDNIHTMRDSLARVVDALRDTESVAASLTGDLPGESAAIPILDRQALRRSGWLRHLSAILEGTLLIVKNVHVNSSHVLIHCSDGWDRTAQLSALSQLCLDPYYRTMRGFMVLVEKDWAAFGHKFLDRCGHLSSEKFFVSPTGDAGGAGSGADAAQAFFASVQNKFVSQKHIQETSPVFHQFLESVRQVQRQHPTRFEFNERFLRTLHYHLYSCQFGNFLFNSERERRIGENGLTPVANTVSVWDFFNAPAEVELNRNAEYDPALDDPLRRETGADMGVLMVNPKDVRFWYQLYGRTDEEMNGRFVVRQTAQSPEFVAPIENGDEDPALVSVSMPTPPQMELPLASTPVIASALESAVNSISSLGRSGSPTPSASTLPAIITSPRSRTSSLREQQEESGGGGGGPSRIQTHSPTPRSPSPLTLTSRRSPRPPQAPPTPSPRGSTSDLLSSGGVRSMWGRFSSGAASALSAVQDAYGGMAKDLSKLSVGADGTTEGGGGELKSREEINAWSAADRPVSPLAATTPGAGTFAGSSTIMNPWNTTKARPGLPSMFLDNPWDTPGAGSAIEPEPSYSAFKQERNETTVTSRLPLDPTVALPTPIPAPRTAQDPLAYASQSSSVTTLPSSFGSFTAISNESSRPATPPQPQVQPPVMSSDPLGVGPL